jgi:hypothetical protein
MKQNAGGNTMKIETTKTERKFCTWCKTPIYPDLVNAGHQHSENHCSVGCKIEAMKYEARFN